MIASSPPPPSPAARPPPQHRAGPWDPYSCSSSGGSGEDGACLSDFAAVILVLACFSFVALCLHCAARVLLRFLDRRRRRAAREEDEEAQQGEPKPGSDAGDGAAAADGVVTAGGGVWAEAECAICLYEMQVQDPEGGGGGERIRVLPACGHGFHAACVGAWLATRASCPTCRAPAKSRSRPSSSRTTRQARQP